MATTGDFERALGSLRALSLGIGATAYTTDYPEALQRLFDHRDLDRHDYLGLTVSQPTSTILVGGRAYKHRESGQHKEDALVFNLQTGTATQMQPSHFLRSFPEYQGYHYADKSYLRTPFELLKTLPI